MFIANKPKRFLAPLGAICRQQHSAPKRSALVLVPGGYKHLAPLEQGPERLASLKQRPG